MIRFLALIAVTLVLLATVAAQGMVVGMATIFLADRPMEVAMETALPGKRQVESLGEYSLQGFQCWRR